MPSASVQLFFGRDLTLDEWHRVCGWIVEAMEEIPDTERYYTVVNDDGTVVHPEDIDHPTFSEAFRDGPKREGSTNHCDVCNRFTTTRYRDWFVLQGATRYGAFVCEDCLAADRKRARSVAP